MRLSDVGWKKALKCIVLAAILLMLVPGLPVHGEEAGSGQGISVYVDGLRVSFTEEPVLDGGHLLVQLRPVLEALGLQPEWDQEQSGVIWNNWNDRSVRLGIGSSELWINDSRYELPVSSRISNGSVMVPLRHLLEKLGYMVDWVDSERRVDVVTDGGYYVFLAAVDDDLEGVREWLEMGAAANFFTGDEGTTPLGMALHQNNPEMAELLLQYGADPNVPVMQKGEASFSLLAAEVYKKNMDAVKLLLRFGADVASDSGGSSALDMARMAEQVAGDETERERYREIAAVLEQGVKEGREALSSDDVLIPFNAGEKAYNIMEGAKGAWGFRDRSGKVVIEPRFAYVRLFSEGLAFAVTRDGSRVGYIDRRGNYQLTIKRGILNIMSGDFSDGLAPAGPNHDAMGYLNKEGEYVVPPVYEWSRAYSEDYGVAKQGARWFVFDRNGEAVLEVECETLFSFHDGLALIRGEKNGFIDLQGELVIDFAELGISEYGEFGNGLAPVMKDGKYGFIDTAGKLVIPAVYETVGNFREGLAYVQLEGKYGFIDSSGRMVIEPQYENVNYFTQGKALVWVDGKIGIIDPDNSMLVEPQYDKLESIMEGSILAVYSYYPASSESQGLMILYKDEERFYLLPDGVIVPERQ